MCDFAKTSGNPNVLEDWEAKELDGLDFSDRYAVFGGAEEFAKLAKKSPLPYNEEPRTTIEDKLRRFIH